MMRSRPRAMSTSLRSADSGNDTSPCERMLSKPDSWGPVAMPLRRSRRTTASRGLARSRSRAASLADLGGSGAGWDSIDSNPLVFGASRFLRRASLAARASLFGRVEGVRSSAIAFLRVGHEAVGASNQSVTEVPVTPVEHGEVPPAPRPAQLGVHQGELAGAKLDLRTSHSVAGEDLRLQ